MNVHVSSASSIRREINVTPLVDVVLVLLIIFMVVTPLAQMGYGVQTPAMRPEPGGQQQIVLRMDRHGHLFINREEVEPSRFQARLQEVLAGRATPVVFVAADGELSYEKVAGFMDLCRDAGAQEMGIVFKDLG